MNILNVGNVEDVRIRELLERTVSIYESIFSNTPEPIQYLKSLGLNNLSLLSHHKTGFCAGTLNDILPDDPAIKSELQTIGILDEDNEERFKDCIVFPAYDVNGLIRSLFGYNIKTNSQVFLPESSTGLWNAGVLKTCSEVVVAPCVLETLRGQIKGYPNILAVQGKDGLTQADIDDLTACGARFSVNTDDIEEGKKLIEILTKAGLLNRVNQSPEQQTESLPESPEPDTIPVPLQIPLQKNKPSDFSVTFEKRNYRIIGLEKGIRKLVATIRLDFAGKLHVDTIDLYSSRSRKNLTQDICRVFNERHDVIETDITRLILECEERLQSGNVSDEPEIHCITESERHKAESLGKSSDLIDRILSDYESIGLIGEDANKLLGYIAMTSRKLSNPLSVMILSSSGAGKTALQDAITAFCPPEDLVKLTTLTGKALFYKGENSLKHKVLAIEEGDGAEEATYAIRNLISSGVLVSESTIKDFSTGKLTTMESRVEGPTAVFLTTTNPNTDPETMSRFFVTGVDESREQTRKILEYQRQNHTQEFKDSRKEKDQIKTVHQNFQRLLQPVSIRNPLSDKLTYGDDRLQSRRDQPKYLMLIKTACFLRQMQKEQITDSQGVYIEVDTEDIRIANRLANEILGRSLDEISRPGRDLLEQLIALAESKAQETEEDLSKTEITFTRKEIRDFTGWANTRVHRYIKELTDLEYILVESGRNGAKYRYRLAYDGQELWSDEGLLGLCSSYEDASL